MQFNGYDDNVPDRSEFCTPVISDHGDPENPVWNHTGELSDYTDHDSLVFTVMDKDVGTDDVLGEATMEISKLKEAGNFHGTLTLINAGTGYVPSLHVKIDVVRRGQDKDDHDHQEHSTVIDVPFHSDEGGMVCSSCFCGLTGREADSSPQLQAVHPGPRAEKEHDDEYTV